MKRLLSILFVMALFGVSYTALAQQDITLDGEWQMTIGGKDYTVNVPHTYNIMEELEDYAGEAVYRRELPITAEMKERTVRLHFEAIHHDAVVYVNGQKVGEHLGKGYTPFSFDITSYLLPHTSRSASPLGSSKNILEVHTSNAYTDKALPYKRSFDWSNDGGIYRSVRLHISGKYGIRYVHATPQASTGTVRFDLRLYDEKVNKVTARFKVTNRQTKALEWEGQMMLSKKKDEPCFTVTTTIGNPQLWHFDQPNLYDFTCETIAGSEVSDALSDHFGFRDFRIEGRSFVLNGEQVRLPGIEDMPGSNPAYGMAEPRTFIEQTVRTMKDLNTCITRFHYVPDRQMVDMMDEMGILCQLELSWWQQPGKQLSTELRQIARETLEEMVEAYYNHPSIYGWGISNEVSGNHEEVKQLADVVRRLDSTRIVDVLSNNTYKTLANDPSLVLDLPTWNEYTGTWHGKNREELPARLERIREAIGERPLFITENGLCEPAFTGGDATRIDDMLYHIKEWQKQDFVCGYIYFCVQDYRTQMGEEGLGRWRIRRHGVCHTDLTPKASYHVLRQLMSPIDIVEVKPANAKKNEGSLAGQYDVDATDHDAHIVLQVKNTIPSYTLRGYALRYADSSGRQQTIALPDLKPGERHPLILHNVNAQYAFEVVRPGGFSVIKY